MNGSQTIPSREDIEVHGGLDEACASKNFLGKSLDEAEVIDISSSESDGKYYFS